MCSLIYDSSHTATYAKWYLEIHLNYISFGDAMPSVALCQIVVEEFLEDINNMLNSGEVPSLFDKDELEQVLATTRPKAKEAGISEGNRDEVMLLYHHGRSFACQQLEPGYGDSAPLGLLPITYVHNAVSQFSQSSPPAPTDLSGGGREQKCGLSSQELGGEKNHGSAEGS